MFGSFSAVVIIDTMNYALYHTNTSLSGQVQMDLVLESDAQNLYVNDFHLVPVSANVPYNRYSTENLLNSKHQENIRSLYEKTQECFYDPCTDPLLTSSFPILTPNPIDPHENQYEYGCRRMSWSLYQKQFNIFIPVWLESLNDSIAFRINGYQYDVNGYEGKEPVISRTVTLSREDVIHDNQFHSRFEKYFFDYIDYIELNDNVICINFDQNYAYLNGLEVSSGNNVVRDISYIVENMKMIERPLMETDYMIGNMFSSTTSICKQLMNFNLCFNVEDLVGGWLVEQLYGTDMRFDVDVVVDGKVLEKRDIWSNYEFIQRKCCNPGVANNLKYNVLDYLYDYRCIDFIDKNKINQSICHWTLCDNEDYVFNVYDGFAGYSISDVDQRDPELNIHTHLYEDAPDITQTIFSETMNNACWAEYAGNNMVANDLNNMRNAMYDMTYEKYSQFDFRKNDDIWVSSIKYHYDGNENLLVVLGIINQDTQIPYWMQQIFVGDDILYYTIVNDYIFLGSKDQKLLTFALVKQAIQEIPQLETLYNIMNGVIQVPVVKFTNTIIGEQAPSPDRVHSKEIKYKRVLANSMLQYVCRYDGNIKPALVKGDRFNYIYYHDYYNLADSDVKLYASNYDKISSGFNPQFPSLNYYPIFKTKTDYDLAPEIKVGYGELPLVDVDNEYCWFNQNRKIVLKPYIEYTFEDVGGKEKAYYIDKALRSCYTSHIDYIRNCYENEISFDYGKNYFDKVNPVKKYTYTIKLTLK